MHVIIKLSCIMKRVGWRCDLFNNLVFKLESIKKMLIIGESSLYVSVKNSKGFQFFFFFIIDLMVKPTAQIRKSDQKFDANEVVVHGYTLMTACGVICILSLKRLCLCNNPTAS